MQFDGSTQEAPFNFQGIMKEQLTKDWFFFNMPTMFAQALQLGTPIILQLRDIATWCELWSDKEAPPEQLLL